jgi:hypothetical protein
MINVRFFSSSFHWLYSSHDVPISYMQRTSNHTSADNQFDNDTVIMFTIEIKCQRIHLVDRLTTRFESYRRKER